MNSLVAFRDDELNSEQTRPLGGPVSRRSRTILFTCEDAQRSFTPRISDRCFIDGCEFVRGQQLCHATLNTRRQLVAQPHICECSTHHHFMIAAPTAIGIELRGLYSTLAEISSCRAVLFDRSSG